MTPQGEGILLYLELFSENKMRKKLLPNLRSFLLFFFTKLNEPKLVCLLLLLRGNK